MNKYPIKYGKSDQSHIDISLWTANNRIREFGGINVKFVKNIKDYPVFEEGK